MKSSKNRLGNTVLPFSKRRDCSVFYVLNLIKIEHRIFHVLVLSLEDLKRATFNRRTNRCSKSIPRLDSMMMMIKKER